ncbi:hypothetical protein EVAR_24245_1 [Eumeta japonica]|uniref:Uncharacterized protein n=1 Tax=Eumeta variegata TaxID=151549 RepID=A0A4C1W4R0_EUMVA|nr:hypothetical protein EVAR_24245_1 [Eumeta japonica]
MTNPRQSNRLIRSTSYAVAQYIAYFGVISLDTPAYFTSVTTYLDSPLAGADLRCISTRGALPRNFLHSTLDHRSAKRWTETIDLHLVCPLYTSFLQKYNHPQTRSFTRLFISSPRRPSRSHSRPVVSRSLSAPHCRRREDITQTPSKNHDKELIRDT